MLSDTLLPSFVASFALAKGLSQKSESGWKEVEREKKIRRGLSFFSYQRNGPPKELEVGSVVATVSYLNGPQR